MTWSAGLLAVTRNLSIVATMHTVAPHRLFLARQIATIDEIGRGRAGLNIVAGWNDPEYRALGLRLPKPTVFPARHPFRNEKNHQKLLEYLQQRLMLGKNARDERLPRIGRIDRDVAGWIIRTDETEVEDRKSVV